MVGKRGFRAKVISVVLSAVVIALIVLAGPAEAFSLSLVSSSSNVSVGEQVSFIASLDIEDGERLPVESLTFKVGAISCEFAPNGTAISGCDDLVIVPIGDAAENYGNFSGNYSGTQYNFGYGYGYGYGGSGNLSYNISLDSSVLGAGVYTTSLRAKMIGESDIFESDGGNLTVSGNGTFVPVQILDEGVDPMCALETDDDITIFANVTGSVAIVRANISYNAVFVKIVNLTETSEDVYSYMFNGSEVGAGNTMTWNIIVTDTEGNETIGGINSLYINHATQLSVEPISPNGLNGWYVSEPNFTLSNPNGTISYRWDDGEFQNYSGSFGLEFPNATFGGIHTLQYKGSVCSEAAKEFVGKFDFTNSTITIISPEDGETINDSTPLVSARIDEVYEFNSGINESSVELLVDGSNVTPTLETNGTLTTVSYVSPVLADGAHTVDLRSSDNAGRTSEASWDFVINTTNATPPVSNLIVYKPLDGIYDERRLEFNITTTEESSRIAYINFNENNPRERVLCRNCDEYGNSRRKTQGLREGENNLSIIAVNELGGYDQEPVFVFIDSKDPKVRKTEPIRGFTDGKFYLEFEELNPSKVLLRYGNSQSGFRNQSVNISACALDRYYKCDVEANLFDYDLEEITYIFEVVDVANNSDESRERTLDVDLTDPVINSFESEVDGRRIDFSFDITEPNFDRIVYTDLSDDNPRQKTLCTRLKEGMCSKRVSFNDGQHEIVFNVLDDAGNNVSQNFSIFLDSRDPRILQTEPRRGETDGEFYVRFREENPSSLVLNYGNALTGLNSSVLNVSSDCHFNGRDNECDTFVNLTDYDGEEISYWFVLTDVAGQSDESAVRRVTVNI